MEIFNQFLKSPILIAVDVLVVSYIIYVLINVARHSQAASLLKGVVLVVFVKIISQTLQLHALNWIMDQVITWGVMAIMIIFQPEIRRYLERLGQTSLFNNDKTKKTSVDVVDNITEAVSYLSKRYIGALVCIENKSGLNNYVRTGVVLGAKLSSQLLINIFTPNTPLHDGAVIIQQDRIAAASCVLPLSENTSIPQELGTRHRAAIGLCEKTDALTIVVSEETGHISLTYQNDLHREITVDELGEFLREIIYVNKPSGKTSAFKKMRAIFVRFGGRKHD